MRTLLALLLLATTAFAQTPTLDGTWSGALDLGAMKLRVVFNIKRSADGYTATMDSPDQGARGIPAGAVTQSGESVTISVPRVGGSFTGKLAGDTLAGTWSQGPAAIPLTLTRGSAPAEPKRTQVPKPPFPYRSEPVSYRNAAADLRLAGTLTLPEGKGPFPAVLMITGSGPQDRDETVMGHKPFLVLADALTRRGIAVLRTDDRGVGESGGSFASATTADFATDAEAGLAYLASRPEIDAKRTGLLGHSEGALVAPLVAARNNKVAFLVLIAAPAVPFKELLPEQARLIAEAAGMPKAEAQKGAAVTRQSMEIIERESDPAARESALRKLLEASVPAAQLEQQIKTVTSPWFVGLVRLDPARTLRKLRIPVLAVVGGKDLQVPAAQNVPALRNALSENKQVEVAEFPSLNHLLQTARTGSPAEYAEIEETVAPAALEKIGTWLQSVVRR